MPWVRGLGTLQEGHLGVEQLRVKDKHQRAGHDQDDDRREDPLDRLVQVVETYRNREHHRKDERPPELVVPDLLLDQFVRDRVLVFKLLPGKRQVPVGGPPLEKL